MDLDVVFLGTAGSMPTARRAPSATLVRRGGERLLIDCGEGTQRQLLRSDLGLVDLQEIFLTHFHADHFLGLPGMLKTFALRGRELPLTLYGPRGLDELFQSLRRVFGRLTFEVDVVELAAERGAAARRLHAAHVPGRATAATRSATRSSRTCARAASTSRPPTRSAFRSDGSAARCRHGEPVTLADGRVVTPEQVLGEARPGRKVVLTGDTAPSDLVVEAAFGADLLVHEATFCEDEAERAAETEHSTALEAARVAQGRERPAARADAQLQPLQRRRHRARGPHGLRGHRRAARLRPDRGAVPRAGQPRARQARRTLAAG